MTKSQTRPLLGIALVLVATMAFALADVATKHLTMIYAVPLVMALRYLINLVVLLALFLPRHGSGIFRTQRTGLVFLRAASLVLGSLSMGLALRYMPVAETVAIVYLSPFIVMLLAIPVLGEKAGPLEWLGAMLGFAGVLLIVRPGAGLDGLGVVLSLINAAAAAVYHILSRVLARSETMHAMLIYTAGIGLGAFAAMLGLMFWGAGGIGPWPKGQDWLFVLALGLTATTGHFLLTAAYREAPASLLAPVNYVHLIWAWLLGWLVFADLPGALGGLGMAMIALAGAGLALRAHFSRIKPPAIPAPLE